MTEKQSSLPQDPDKDQFIEPYTDSFVIKLWIIDHEEAQGKRDWRGHITHVASGQRTYFDSLLKLNKIIVPYLKKMDAKLPFWWRAYKWLMH